MSTENSSPDTNDAKAPETPEEVTPSGSDTKTTPESTETTPQVTPAPDPQVLKELEELRKFKAEQERAKLSEQERVAADLKAAQEQVTQYRREAMIAKAQVPSELEDLLPQDPEKLEAFLASDRYKNLKASLAPKPTPPSPDPAPKQDKQKQGDKGKSGPDFQAIGSILRGIV